MGDLLPPLCKTRQLSAIAAGRDRREVLREIDLAAQIVRGGGTVAFPTETVYGLGANALDAKAIVRIFAAKQRPRWDPLIVHVGDRAMLEQVASIPPELAPRVKHLMATFWPGPLTLLLPRTPAIPDSVTAGRPLVGVRMPSHPVALELIRLAGVPIAAPSANRFGHTSPTSAAHVLDDLDGRIDAVLDGGSTSVGIESTVLDVTRMPMLIYRPGTITAGMLRRATGCDVMVYNSGQTNQPAQAGQRGFDSVREISPASLPSPGVGLRHYAPRARLELVELSRQFALGDSMLAAVERARAAGEITGVMLPSGWDAPEAEAIFPCGDWGDDEFLASCLFAGLRWLDARGVDVILCPRPTGDGVAAALRDRLDKAAMR